MGRVESRKITTDESGMRLDRWLKSQFPALGFGQMQKLMRTGQVRVDGSRVSASKRLEAGQIVRIPPLPDSVSEAKVVSKRPRKVSKDDREALEQMMLFDDGEVMVLNKATGLSVQGGSGVTRHVDGMLETMCNKKGDKPRLVHRLDRDTSGVLVVAKTRQAAVELTKSFRSRNTKKIYWALVRGVPKPKQGRLSNYLVRLDNELMRVCKHGEPDAQHALSLYSVVESSGGSLSWVTLKPVTGRTHQLRVQMQSIGNPIIGDAKYFDVENWTLPTGMQNKLHLLARRIIIPHPRGGVIDVTAPLPPHMQQSWNLMGFETEFTESEMELE